MYKVTQEYEISGIESASAKEFSTLDEAGEFISQEMAWDRANNAAPITYRLFEQSGWRERKFSLGITLLDD